MFIKAGDLIYYDSFFHLSTPSRIGKGNIHPKEYAVPGIVIKKYSTKEKEKLLGSNHKWKEEDFFEILIQNHVQVVPRGCLLKMCRETYI